jgi:hypothetical protein
VQSVRVSVVIATWNAAAVLGRCLESLKGQEVEGGFETVVLDNGSTDDTADVLRRHADAIRVVVNEENTGFSAGNNRGASEARGEILFFLNSDTELLAPDVLQRLAAALDDPSVGLAGPMLRNPDGSLQPSCAAHPGVAQALLTATGLKRLVPERAAPVLAPERWSHDRPIDLHGWLMGPALMIRADLFEELGGFWPTTYAEDQELCYRVQQRGLKVRFEPSARIMHVGNVSLGQRFPGVSRAAEVANAELVFLRTYYSRPRRLAIRAIVGLGYAARAAAHRLLRRPAPAEVYRAMAGVYAAGGVARRAT